MDFRLGFRPGARVALGAAAMLLMTIATAREARAQAALDDDDNTDAAPASTIEAAPQHGPRIGVGLRLRNVRMPRSFLEVFVDRAPGGSSEVGFGLEVVRRNRNFEFAFGLEYEKIFIEEGIWVERDKPPPGDEVDYVEFDDFAWITADVTFLHHTSFGPYFALRYGGGLGIGLLMGDVRRTDYMCTSSDLDSCGPYVGAANDRTPYDLPPVFPVVTALFGGQITPVPNIAINIEAGIRTLPFFGTSVVYYF